MAMELLSFHDQLVADFPAQDLTEPREDPGCSEVEFSELRLQEDLDVHAHKLQVTIPEEPDREIAVHLPDDFPAGPAEVIVLTGSQEPARDVDRPYQPTLEALEELLSFEATPEEEKILEDFESFRGPGNLADLIANGDLESAV